MKRCPACNQLFTEDNMFCQNDGTSLLYVPETGQNPTVFQTSGEMPTQYIQRPPNTATGVRNDSSKWLYLIIGVLATALVAVGAVVFLGRGGNEKNEASETKAEAGKNTRKDEELPKNTQSPVNAAPSNTPPVQPPVNPNLTPGGSWKGDWNSKSTYFTAVASLTETGGNVSGQIVWTLQRTLNPKKINKVGISATEYVQGTFNPVTRMVSLRGVRKDDPNNIVILDKYNLSLAENNQLLSGKSINGSFILRR